MTTDNKIRLRVMGSSKDPVIVDELAAAQAPPGVKVTANKRIVLGGARAATGAEQLDVDGGTLACVEYDDGFRLWTRADALRRDFARPARGTRGGHDDVWEFDAQLAAPTSQRGVAKIAVKALEFFDIDVAAMSAHKLCDWFEQRQLDDRGEGLYRLRLDGPLELTPVDDALVDGDGPILLLLHGTASSTAGSFSDLWQPPEGASQLAGEERGAMLRRLAGRFAGRVFGFEHRTLTQGPIENALDLVRRLPDGAELYLVSHSRGGLVGELLSLGQLAPGADRLDAALLDRVFDARGDLSDLFARLSDEEDAQQRDAYRRQRQQLDELLALLQHKQLRIRRFLRVACPARGTTLASGRLDRWLSVLEFLGGESFVGDLVYFLLGVIKKRTDPRTLPGLEAMMPQSALVRLLNHPRLEVTADLSVIAGDLRADSLWRRLKLAVADWFYAGDHDLVVNTGSMYGGIRRSEGLARHLFDPGAKVHHFRYFTNATTSDAMILALEDELARFGDIEAAVHKDEIPVARDLDEAGGSRSARPVAIVLPGTMGSNLAVDGDRVWLDYWALAFGGLDRLRIRRRDGVATDGLLKDFYRDFVLYLRRSHRVHTYPYDWRKSVGSSVDGLARLIEQALADCEMSGQPLRLVAHSMGGLVARLTLARHPQLWQRMRALSGSRVLMLGTPNRGSHEAMRWLTGFNPTLNKLRLLDQTNGRDGLLKIVSRYPGLLELLPAERGATDFASADFWSDLKQSLEESWPLPTGGDLGRLPAIWDELEAAPADPEHMLYVAGCAATTVNDYEIDPQGDSDPLGNPVPTLKFFATSRGDGTVTWESGRLPGVPTWFVEQAQHDELLTHVEAFPAYLDLLQTGNTTRLPDVEPRAKRAAAGDAERILLPTAIPDSIPGEQDMRGMVFGGGRVGALPARAPLPRVSLSVRHGDLTYASSPVCVGHYAGDTIVSAERALDRGLDGALVERAALGLYPDAIGTHHVFIHPDATVKPGGAVVVGLGEVGSLSPGRLELALVQAFLDYASEVARWTDERFGADDVVRHARLNCLLIGTGFDNMTVRDSVTAILRAVRIANERLHRHELDKKVLIDELTLLELYEDVAIQAARDLALLLDTDEFGAHFDWPVRQLDQGVGGHRRVMFEEAPNWWHRLEIVYDTQREVLRYHAFTDRARVEESLVAGEMRLAEDFIADTIATTRSDPKLAKTLFEMLVPNRLKEQAPDRRDLVLVVDEVSARFPWELMQDRWAHDGQPLSVASGMLRQLKVGRPDNRSAHSLDMNALVIGDPYLGHDDSRHDPASPPFDQLQGAYDESMTVDRTFRQHGYASTAVIRKDAQQILTALHADSYRILHLAGHGVHEFELADDRPAQHCDDCEQVLPRGQRRVSGMVIGRRRFLTPGDVQQMRVVPQLVFINCCHLGKTGDPGRLNELAANLGVQFIRMGVRAVVATGWAVDDAAAERFARAFYQAMFRGDTFGDAVRNARAEVWQRDAASNTWGAYQCYGDPGFRLEAGGRSRPGTVRDFVSPAELVVELRNLCSRVKTSGTDAATVTALLARLDGVLERIPLSVRDPWLARADVCEARGILYGELGRFEEAIEQLDKALQGEKADLSVTAIQQRANFAARAAAARARVAVADADPDKAGQRRLLKALKEADAEIAAAIADLERLCAFASTAERQALLGSAYKRRAQIAADNDAKLTYLQACAEHYHASYALRRDNDERVSYPLTQWLTARALARVVGKRNVDDMLSGDLGDETERECDGMRKRAAIQERRAPDFWNTAVPTDCIVLRSLARLSFDRHADAIIKGYQLARARGGSPREMRSVGEHLDFLHVVLQARAMDFGSRSQTAIRLEAQLTAIRHIADRLALQQD